MSVRPLLFALPLLCAAAAVAATVEHGVQTASMDTSVRPGEDFNAYANGAWMKATTIPADQASWGSFASLRDKAAKRTADLIEDLAKKASKPGSDEQKIGDTYAAYMDEAGIEAKGLTPLKGELAEIAAIATPADLARRLGRNLRADVDPLNNTNFYTENPLGLWAGPGFDDPDHYTAYLLQGGLGLPDRSYYLGGNDKANEIIAAYRAHIVTVLALAGIADAQKKADGIVALETRIAQAHGSRADNEEVLKANNRWSRADFAAKAPGLDWDAFFDGAGLLKQNSFTVWQASALPGLAAAAHDVPLDVWKDYLTFHLLNHFSGVLPKAFADERFAFYGTKLSGTPQQAPRWKRAVAATNEALGWAVGRLYTARYFPPAYRQRALKMVAEIRAAFARRIDKLDWMSPKTKAKAKAKLATLYVGVGYPDRWVDYGTLAAARDDAFGNMQRAELFQYARNVALLGAAVDRSTWCMTPQTVNAVNLPLQNALNFPAAIMDPPFFDAQADSAFNYGAIGAIIGHEISHSFDDQGAQFDAKGRLLDWWTPEDLAHFRESANRLAEQYSRYSPFPGVYVNGQLTLSENIADVAGMSAAYDGWIASLHGKPQPKIAGLTGAQRFFIAYAQTRQAVIREAALRQQVLTDGHAPSMCRAFAVRNLDAWYKAFDVAPGDALYLAPDKRVQVW